MLSAETIVAYVLTVLAIMVLPGPSHLLMAVNSFEHGFQKALATAAGDLTANTLQIALAGCGFAALVLTYPVSLSFLRWAGVGYLIFLGVGKIFAWPPKTESKKKPGPGLWLQGFLTSLSNPKALVFFLALFPPFIAPDKPLFSQILVLGLLYLGIDGAFLAGYGLLAGRLKRSGFSGQRLSLVSGFGLIAVAVYLGWKGMA